MDREALDYLLHVRQLYFNKSQIRRQDNTVLKHSRNYIGTIYKIGASSTWSLDRGGARPSIGRKTSGATPSFQKDSTGAHRLDRQTNLDYFSMMSSVEA